MSLFTIFCPPAIADDPLSLETEEEGAELVLEAFLSPGEFSNRRFFHISTGDEAVFSLDSSLGSSEPFAELNPERLTWPWVAGLELRVEGQRKDEPLKLLPANDGITDDSLDEGFIVRWVLAPIGQRFDPKPHFVAKVVEAEVMAVSDGRRLLFWKRDAPPPICAKEVKKGHPNCRLTGIGLEARAVALSPDGQLLALAMGGIRPRIEIYDVKSEPKLKWQSLLGSTSGGAVEVSFSADGQWIVTLTGKGAMHRFDAKTGGRHLSIPSSGQTARAVPPGRIMAVAGKAGEINLWYLNDGTIAWHLPPRQLRGPVDRLAASGDGRKIATLEYDEESTVVRVWEINKRSMLAQIEVDPYAISDIALDHEGKTLYVAHEKEGLLSAKVKPKAKVSPVTSKEGWRCRGRLQLVTNRNLLNCSLEDGAIQLDHKGRLKKNLKTSKKASDWKMAVTAKKTAAIGGGDLLIWWTD